VVVVVVVMWAPPPSTCMQHALKRAWQQALFDGHLPYFIVQLKKSQLQSAKNENKFDFA
jgi:hypothetical protein